MSNGTDVTMNKGSFDFNEFIKESKDIVVNPNYFATMKTTGGMGEPLIKAVIYGAIAGLITFIYSLIGIGGIGGGLFGGAVGVMALVSMIIGAVIGVFIGGVVMLILSAICKGNTDYEANLRVAAALMVLMPVNAALGFLGGINFYLGFVAQLAVSLFGIWLTYKALVQALKANQKTAQIVMYVLIALTVLVMLGGMSARRSAARFMDNFNSSDLKEMIDEMPQN